MNGLTNHSPLKTIGSTRTSYSVLAMLLIVFSLTACQTNPTDDVTFEDVLSQTTVELTAAANTLADAADAGIVKRDSHGYLTAKAALFEAQTYIELSWQYYADGDLDESHAARRLAVGSYQSVRPILVEYQKSLE